METTTINEIFRTYGPAYIEQFGEKMPTEHHKAIEAIVQCRTDQCGITVYQCNGCGQTHMISRSCGSRNCPTCQNHKAHQWLQWQLERQLPGHHFLITFTVPEQIRAFIRSHQNIAYNAMFKASSEALKVLAADKKYVGGELPGFFGVLHSWGRKLPYHPHIHYVAPGGALSRKDGRWYPSRIDFFVPVKALSQIFRAKFRDEMKKAGLLAHIPPEVWNIDWNVNIQPVGNCEQTIRYLAPYVFKVAISNKRIVKVENHKVTFRYKKDKSSRYRSTTLDVMEFMRRFLQHVLPTGFMKVRYYGFMHPSSSVSLEEISTRIELCYGFQVQRPKADLEPAPPFLCPECGGTLHYRYSILPLRMSLWLDSG